MKRKPHMKRKTVSVLGSTGSVGCNTLNLIKDTPDRYQIVALTANTNVSMLAEQARNHSAQFVAIADESKYSALKEELSGSDVEVAAGQSGLIEAAVKSSDFIMSSIVGVAGLPPTFEAVKCGKTIGLANKECLVSAGDIFLKEVEASKASLIPVDSEHSAIFQIFDHNQTDKVRRIILTASGGPFRNFTIDEMKNVTCEQATAHPNWSMGKKISVDSATMMNKGLELIEAYYLFPIKENQIEILIHPESVIHSLVDYVDGSVLAQMGVPDMKTPISYALGWPKRVKTNVPKLALEEIGKLTFEPPNVFKFPALQLSRETLKKGGSAPTILNAANEVAVDKFLLGKINFPDIVKIIEDTLEKLDFGHLSSINDVIEVDSESRKLATTLAK